jgi:hypothetical protein
LKGRAELTFVGNGVDATRTNFLYDETTNSDGPNFDIFARNLERWAVGKQVQGVIWDQGQADTQYVVNAALADQYITGLNFVLGRLMSLSGAKDVYIEGLGGRGYFSPTLHGGADLMHDLQQDFDKDHDYVHLVSNTYDLPLKDTTHLAADSVIASTTRMADAISTGFGVPVLDRAFVGRDGKMYVTFALTPGQTLDGLAGLGGIRWNGQDVASVVVDSHAGLLIVFPAEPILGCGYFQYASATYSFGMGGQDVLTVNGPTGHIPVQPFTVETDQTVIGLPRERIFAVDTSLAVARTATS